MLKKILLIKKFNKLLISVNERIESFFNHISILLNSKKKIKNNLKKIDKKIIIGFGSLIILILTYFLIPVFYNKDLVRVKLTNQILKKYNLEVKFDGNLKYGLFPKPHFFIKDTIIIYDKKTLAKTDTIKVYITIKNFFSSKDLKIKNLSFNQSEFNIDANNFSFFKKILNSNQSRYNINFKKNNFFYKDKNEDVIFLANIKDLNFLYNDDFNQQLDAYLDIFNIPLKIKIINNLKKKNAFINIDSHKLRMNIKNNFDYSKERTIGSLDLNIINKQKKFNYTIKKNSLEFDSDKNNFKGRLDFIPFYLTSDLRFSQFNIEKMFNNNAIFLDLLNTEILNNQKLNAEINIYFDEIKNVNHIENIILRTYFEEGNIYMKNSSFNWKNSILINLDMVQLITENNKIIFTGEASLEFNDIAEFYKHNQVKKINRKKINQIKLDFLYNLFESEIQFDNLKIDGVSNKDVNNFVNDFNSKKVNVFNKVLLRNTIKDFFSKF